MDAKYLLPLFIPALLIAGCATQTVPPAPEKVDTAGLENEDLEVPDDLVDDDFGDLDEALEDLDTLGGGAPADQPTAPESTVASFSTADVATHNGRASCWTIVNGAVYDVTAFIDKHPGGAENVLKLCGKDGSVLFGAKHGGQAKPEAALESLKIGALA